MFGTVRAYGAVAVDGDITLVCFHFGPCMATMSQKWQCVVFDFDYTLADSSAGAVACVNHALEQMGLPTAPPEQVHRTIGMSLPATLAALTEPGAHHRAEEFDRLFMERAEQVMADRTVLFPTTGPTLRTLKDQGLSLGIVSTKTRRRIVSILQREGLEGHFGVIIGGGEVSVHKPDPRGLLLAAEQLCCVPSEVLYVGDSVIDAEAAQRGGMSFVAVLSGVAPKGAFKDYATVAVIETLNELPVVLAN